MSFQVFLHPRAADFLKKADPGLRRRIKERLAELRERPEQSGERLHPSPFWRLRIGDYRAIYEIDRKERRVVILHIGHRRDIYDEFSKLL